MENVHEPDGHGDEQQYEHDDTWTKFMARMTALSDRHPQAHRIKRRVVFF